MRLAGPDLAVVAALQAFTSSVADSEVTASTRTMARTCSHMDLNGATVAEFEQEIIKGEVETSLPDAAS